MDTKKINKGNVRMIAHRGLSGIEPENTVAAFVAAGNRSYFGIETDVHVTGDGKYVILHDDWTGRVFCKNINVETSTFDELRSLTLSEGYGGAFRSDCKIPELSEYIAACKRYGKKAVLELKLPMAKEHVVGICDVVKECGYFDDTIFISFYPENLIRLRELYPDQPAQFLAGQLYDNLLEKLAEMRVDLDIAYTFLTEEMVKAYHDRGLKVNCWTVDNPADAERLASWGVDFITTDILE
ncbi:MAG: hypothetical protein IKX86_02850 [Clostridia bacterium]|nr:hypothetical protein [Clostridia bacterium]MBR5767601.1 hypothetical protein [Clostridia bacterium]